MSGPRGHGSEIERYELDGSPAYRFELDRRELLRAMGAGIVVAATFTDALPAQESGRRRTARQMPEEIDAWLHVGDDGFVQVFTGKVEVGQNIRTSLAQAVAEELRVPVDRVRMVMGDTDLTPYDRGTFGSQTTPVMAAQLRRVAAVAREVLVDLAALRWGAEPGALEVADGAVTDPESGRSAEFGALTEGRKLIRTIAEDTPLTPANEWRVAGRSIPKVGGREFVTGAHKYPSDVRVPGMMYGKVLRPPAFGARLTALDAGAAEADGARVVHDGDFVAVAAPTPAGAERAVAALRCEWQSEPQPSGGELFTYLREHPREVSGWGGSSSHVVGSLEEGLAAADFTLKQTYTVAYIAHVPLEPRAAVAQWTDGKLTVWTGTQRPFGVRGELAEAFRIPEERVRVIMPDTGSGYGGKHTGEAAVEAARIAKAVGKPVKLVWTREEELTWAYFRPAGVIDVASGARSDGTLTAWEFHNYNSGASAIRPLYEIPNQRIEFHATESPLRQGSYRALAATANHFARETHLDEVARRAGLDPLRLRYKNLKDERLRAVFAAASEAFGWGRKKDSPDQGFGLAGGFEKGGYVATCAEVRVDRESGDVKILRVVQAFECGAIVNPDHLRNQVEGAIIMGIGGALWEAIEFDDGKILNAHLALYRVPRFPDVPKIETVLVDRPDLPSAGAGEAPIVGIAPAVGNAIFDATGIRLRDLPLVPRGLELQAG